MTPLVSNCCGADYKVAGDGETHWYSCCECGEPCDIETLKKFKLAEKVIHKIVFEATKKKD